MSISNPNIPKSIQGLTPLTTDNVAARLVGGDGGAGGFAAGDGVWNCVGCNSQQDYIQRWWRVSYLGARRSRTQIGGPTGAFVVIVAGIVARFGMSGLAMVTAMAGVLLLLMDLTGGAAVKFIPRMV